MTTDTIITFSDTALIAIIIALLLIQYWVFSLMAGIARVKGNVEAPATSGDENYERALRVQQNTLEQLIIVIPSLWLFGTFVDPTIAAGLGFTFFVARLIYAKAYRCTPKKRAPGFIIGMLATIILLLGGLIGAILGL